MSINKTPSHDVIAYIDTIASLIKFGATDQIGEVQTVAKKAFADMQAGGESLLWAKRLSLEVSHGNAKFFYILKMIGSLDSRDPNLQACFIKALENEDTEMVYFALKAGVDLFASYTHPVHGKKSLLGLTAYYPSVQMQRCLAKHLIEIDGYIEHVASLVAGGDHAALQAFLLNSTDLFGDFEELVALYPYDFSQSAKQVIARHFYANTTSECRDLLDSLGVSSNDCAIQAMKKGDESLVRHYIEEGCIYPMLHAHLFQNVPMHYQSASIIAGHLGLYTEELQQQLIDPKSPLRTDLHLYVLGQGSHLQPCSPQEMEVDLPFLIDSHAMARYILDTSDDWHGAIVFNLPKFAQQLDISIAQLVERISDGLSEEERCKILKRIEDVVWSHRIFGLDTQLKDVLNEDSLMEVEKRFQRAQYEAFFSLPNTTLGFGVASYQILARQLVKEKDPLLKSFSSLFAAPSLRLGSAEEQDNMVEKIAHGQPVVLHAGWERHAMSLVIKDGYLAICNRGEGAGAAPVRLYVCSHIDSRQWKAIIERVAYMQTRPYLEGKRFFYTTLPALLGEKRDILCEKLMQHIEGKEQKVGNCAIASPLIALRVLYALERCRGCTQSDIAKKAVKWCEEANVAGKTLRLHIMQSFAPSLSPVLSRDQAAYAIEMMRKREAKIAIRTLHKKRFWFRWHGMEMEHALATLNGIVGNLERIKYRL